MEEDLIQEYLIQENIIQEDLIQEDIIEEGLINDGLILYNHLKRTFRNMRWSINLKAKDLIQDNINQVKQ